MHRGTDRHSEGFSTYWAAVAAVGFIIVALAIFGILFLRSSNRSLQLPTAATRPGAVTGRCPLTGLPASDESATTQKPVVVQIDNAPEARPQAGLGKADIVYEELAEGGITRYSAVFACQDAEQIGPVRSARLVDIELVPEYQGLLADSGASQGTTQRLADATDVPDINEGAFPGAFMRVGDRAAPHNLMTTAAMVREAASVAGFDIQADLSGTPRFGQAGPPAGSPSVSYISVPVSDQADVSYRYDQAGNGWLRFIAGVPQRDALDGRQIEASNVIIQFVTVTQSNIIEDANGDRGLEFTLTGSGRALIFRDGQVVDGQWNRSSRGDMTRYTDSSGNPVQLEAGQTWVQLVPPDFQATWN